MDNEGHIDFSDLGEDANHLRQCQPVLGPGMYADEKEAVGPAPGQWGYAAPAEGGAGTDLPGPETAILRLLFIRKRLPLSGVFVRQLMSTRIAAKQRKGRSPLFGT